MTDTPKAGEPGALSTPDGDGPVRVGDRTREGSPGANQSKTEPHPPTSGHDAPAGASGPAPGGGVVTGVPVSEIGLGAGDPQAPSHPVAADRPFTQVASGPPPSAEGTAQRARGQQGVAEEPIETDSAASAAAMAPPAGFSDAPGDAKSVPVVSDESSEGTSETAPIVQGVRTPVE